MKKLLIFVVLFAIVIGFGAYKLNDLFTVEEDAGLSDEEIVEIHSVVGYGVDYSGRLNNETTDDEYIGYEIYGKNGALYRSGRILRSYYKNYYAAYDDGMISSLVSLQESISKEIA